MKRYHWEAIYASVFGWFGFMAPYISQVEDSRTLNQLLEITSAIRHFFRWWGAELKSLFPKNIIERFPGSSIDFAVSIGPENIFIINQKNRQEDQILEFGRDSNPSHVQLEKALQLIRKLGLRAATNCEIDGSHILRKQIALPKNVLGQNLPLIIQNQIQKLTPFGLNEVFFDYCQLEPKPNDDEVNCDIAIIHKKYINSYLHVSSSLDIFPESLSHAAMINGEERKFCFLLNKGAISSRSITSWVKAALFVFLIILAATIFALPLYRQNEQIQQLEAIVQSKKEMAQLSSKTIGEISEISEVHNFIVQKKSSSPSKIEILNELSNILPSHTWIFGLVEGKGFIEIQGYSENTSEIIPLIETSPFFLKVNLSSGIVRNTNTNKERFHLKFEIAGSEPK